MEYQAQVSYSKFSRSNATNRLIFLVPSDSRQSQECLLQNDQQKLYSLCKADNANWSSWSNWVPFYTLRRIPELVSIRLQATRHTSRYLKTLSPKAQENKTTCLLLKDRKNSVIYLLCSYRYNNSLNGWLFKATPLSELEFNSNMLSPID